MRDIFYCQKIELDAPNLLWYFLHPRILNISSSFKMIIYLINQLLYRKNSSHSTSHENKPQLNQLKVYKFDRKMGFFFLIIIRIPIWYDVKLIGVAWLVLPQFRGATFIYETYVREKITCPPIK